MLGTGLRRTIAVAVVAIAALAGTASAQTATGERRQGVPEPLTALLANPLLEAGLFTAPVPTASATAQTGDASQSTGVRFGPRHAVEQLPCRPGDAPETGLQGRVPPTDTASGRAALGYRCNLQLVGHYSSSSSGTLEAYGDCAYYGLASDVTGTQVLDVSHPALPTPTTVLATPAMLSPWESLKVNAMRKLLVADRWSLLPADTDLNSYLDIYDVSGDCRHPRLLSSTDMAPAHGHEGWFSPDGMTYFMSTTGPDGTPTVFPIDISDPAHPKRLASWTFPAQTHGGFTTEDDSRSYICQQQAPPNDKLLIVDTSELITHRSDPKPHLLAQIPLGDNQWCQAALRVTYDGHPFLIQYGERSGAADCSRSKDNWANFGYPRIFDFADERHPKLVSSLLLQVDLPQHCAQVTGEGALNGLGYSGHHCSVDRLYNPTILACDYFGAGMRVTDIRNPHKPVEIGYFNPGTTAVVGTGARPVIHAERGEIWFTNDVQGFYVVRFEDGIWPFKDSARCPEFDDYYYAQYNPGSTCPTANFRGIGKPAPGLVHAAVRRPRPALELRVSPSHDPRAPYRFRVSGRLVPPASTPPSQACKGSMTLTVHDGQRAVLRRTLPIHPNCRVRTTVTETRTVHTLVLTLHFAGNSVLAAVSKRTLARTG